jgi:hypothetical protein
MNKKFLYIRTTATLADDDDAAQSICVPVESLVGMNPTADDALTLYFKSLNNINAHDDHSINDTVALTIGANKHKEVMQSYC